jgi:hypothetical protein
MKFGVKVESKICSYFAESSTYICAILGIGVGFILTSLALIFLDSIYFGGIKISLHLQDIVDIYDLMSPSLWPRISIQVSFNYELKLQGHWVLTPLNSLLYNMKFENLAGINSSKLNSYPTLMKLTIISSWNSQPSNSHDW